MWSASLSNGETGSSRASAIIILPAKIVAAVAFGGTAWSAEVQFGEMLAFGGPATNCKLLFSTRTGKFN